VLGHEVEAAWPAAVAAGTEHHSAGTIRDVQEVVAQGTAAVEVLAVGWQAGDFWAGHRRLADVLAQTYTLELPGLHCGVVVATTHTSPLSLQVHHFSQEGTGKTCWGHDRPCSHGIATIDVVDLVPLAVTAVEVEESCTSRLVVLAVVQQQRPALALEEAAAAPAQSAAAERLEVSAKDDALTDSALGAEEAKGAGSA
jgi:hypothetical protein